MTKTLELTTAEIKVFSILLDRAVDERGDHGCNDFSLGDDAGLSLEEINQIDRELRKVFPSDMQERPGIEDNVSDFFLLALLEEKIKALL